MVIGVAAAAVGSIAAGHGLPVGLVTAGSKSRVRAIIAMSTVPAVAGAVYGPTFAGVTCHGPLASSTPEMRAVAVLPLLSHPIAGSATPGNPGPEGEKKGTAGSLSRGAG